MTYTPAFAAQNPAISDCAAGWSSCTTFAAAMAVDFDSLGARTPTGCTIRRWTGDYSGGTTLAQVDDALRTNTGTNLDVRYRLPWTDFARRINAGQGAILQGWYQPISVTRFDGGGGFIGNHAVFVPPGWGAMDPLADGRRAGIYKYHREVYPQSLLKDFAGKLNIGAGRIVRLGAGLVYAAFTRDNEAAYAVSVGNGKPGYPYFAYKVIDGKIGTPPRVVAHTGGFSADCTPPRLYRWEAEKRSISLVRVLTGSHGDERRGAGKGQYISAKLAHEEA